MKILTFGELMLRLKTPEHLKILQADTFEASYGGAEANVAVSLATLGNDVSYVTKVPEHQVGQAAINEIRRFGVDTTRVLRGGGRVGIYYFEKGTNIRPTSVVYDRAYSAIAGQSCFTMVNVADGTNVTAMHCSHRTAMSSSVILKK